MGSGFYFTPIQASNFNPFANVAPFAGTFTLTDVAFEDPFGSKGQANPFPSNFGPDIPGPEFVFAPINDVRTYFAKDYRIPQLITWTARLERQFGGDWVGSVAYLGNKGTYLQYTINENPPSSGLGPLSATPRTGGSTRTSVRRPLRCRRQFHLPFAAVESGKAVRPWLLDPGQLHLVEESGRPVCTNPFNRTISRGPSSFDVPHNFKFSNLWEIPKLQVSPQSEAAQRLAGQLDSGKAERVPFTVTSGQDNSFSNVGSDRADYIGGEANLSDSRPLADKLAQWFDTSRFVVNALGTFGNSGRGILRGPGFFNTDLGVLKSTALTERTNLQFRAVLQRISTTRTLACRRVASRRLKRDVSGGN
jgi:hypothetical protein